MKRFCIKGISIGLLCALLFFCGFASNQAQAKNTDIKDNAYLALSLHKADVLRNQAIPQIPTIEPEDEWRLLLVNREHPLPDAHAFEGATLSNGMIVDARIVDALNGMIAQARADGVSIFVCSAYRTVEYQEGLFERKINQYIAKGYDEQSAYDIAKTIVAIPKTSEHHTGLAVDIITPSYQILDEGFERTDAYIWLKENCAEFGFILRYPNEKSEITGIIYEPWHYRYVGVKEAKEIMVQGITLEEYLSAKTMP